jgi:hypothetical protein
MNEKNILGCNNLKRLPWIKKVYKMLLIKIRKMRQ